MSDASIDAVESSNDRSGVAGISSQNRSRITNGSTFLPGVDGRSAWVRRARDVQLALVADRGGEGLVSEAETLIIRRSSVLEAELERMEMVFAKAGEADEKSLDLYSRLSNTQRRLLESVGLERRAKDMTPTLSSYVVNASRAAKPAANGTASSEESDDG